MTKRMDGSETNITIRKERCAAMGKKGFSLVELMVASSITCLTLTAAISLYSFYWGTYKIGNNVLDIYANSRLAMEYMSRDIRWATQVVASNSPYTTDDHCIVLQVPSIDAAGNVITSRYDYITYKLQGTDLFRIVQKDAASSRLAENRAIAHYCASLNFSSGGVALSGVANLSVINTVGIYLPINRAVLSLSGSGDVIESMNPTTVVRLRNK